MIKGYSPELIVHPYDNSKIDFFNSPETAEIEMKELKERLGMYHVLVMGCGMGRSGGHKLKNDPIMLEQFIIHAVANNMMLVGDADFLWYL